MTAAHAYSDIADGVNAAKDAMTKSDLAAQNATQLVSRINYLHIPLECFGTDLTVTFLCHFRVLVLVIVPVSLI